MDVSTIISILATSIAACALGISIYEGFSNRKHNRLSVKPLLRFHYTNTPDLPVTVKLVNKGIGPAVIYYIDVLVHDGDCIRKYYLDSFEYLNENNINDAIRVWMPTSDGEILDVGGSILLLQFTETTLPSRERNNQLSQLQQLEYRVNNCSIYGKKFGVKCRLQGALEENA